MAKKDAVEIGTTDAVRAEFEAVIPAIESWGQGERQAKLKEISLSHGITLEEFFTLDKYYGGGTQRGGGEFGEKVEEKDGTVNHAGLWPSYIHNVRTESVGIRKMLKALPPEKQAEALSLIQALLAKDA